MCGCLRACVTVSSVVRCYPVGLGEGVCSAAFETFRHAVMSWIGDAPSLHAPVRCGMRCVTLHVCALRCEPRVWLWVVPAWGAAAACAGPP